MNPKRLLVVDDEPDIGKLICEFAKVVGYEAKATTSAQECMQKLDEFAPTVIVMDVVMPETDGIELIQQLAQANYQNKIIVMTGYNPNYVDFAKDIGENFGHMSISTLTKPFTRDKFFAILKRL
ncbi:hypothetical protein TI05_05370 [Achromatium sp. WMS3]|nr:hypothetical protein TI05_05370 [Achromatium sp. WMS3]